MLQPVKVLPRQLEAYRPVIGDQRLELIRRMAEPLQGARVLHINATAFGGGVAEILATLVPLMCDVGLQAEWQVIEGDHEFFSVSKASHNGLQGMNLAFTDEMKAVWRRCNEANAKVLEGTYDFIVVHDPQPAGLLSYAGRSAAAHWIWRCHIDTSHPTPEFWDFYAPFVNAYDAMIFTMADYAGPGVDRQRVAVIPPSIDPLAPKNDGIRPGDARQVLARFGVDPARPLMTQVSRFDPWKDPLGVIDAYRMVKQSLPEIQLALIGSMASDDPEGWFYLDKTSRHAGADGDIHILHNFQGVGGFEVGCFQMASDIVVQKSTREGFGLVVSEALWKRKPVVGGKVGGIPLQILDGKTGFLVDSMEACAARSLELLKDPVLAGRMGEAGHEHVREHFLVTRNLLDYLSLFHKLRGATPEAGNAKPGAQ